MKKKTIALLLVMMMIFGISVGGTIAFLQDSKSVKNTFTVGNVQIKLDEAVVGDDGKAIDAEKNRTNDTVTGNTYHLVPGGVYDKDPTVTVLKGSDEAYVRMIVKVKFEKVLDEKTLNIGLDDIFTGYNSAWERADKAIGSETTKDKTCTVITYEYRYNTPVEGKADGTDKDNPLPALFTGVKVPSTWGNAELEAVGNFEITVEAHAIQTAGFNGDVDAAWTAFKGQ